MITSDERVVIDVRGVGKRYRRPSNERQSGSLRNLGDLRGRVDHWALRDVTFAVRFGESVGIVGRNGAGKSTLLRLLSGVTAATTGTITLHSPVSGLLTLGDSFTPLLTAEENALTAAILAGLSRKQAKQRISDIAAFAELEDVIDQPLRTFSDGMKLRLAFAVSVHVEPKVLLIDEVLAVGDIRFRQKCLAELQRLREEESLTLVLTSHDMDQVRSLCDRALWLSDGVVALDGPPDEVTDEYLESYAPHLGDTVVADDGTERVGTGEIRVSSVTLGSGERTARSIVPGDPLVVVIEARSTVPVDDAVFNVSVYDADEVLCFNLSTHHDAMTVDRVDGDERVELRLHRLDLAPGEYRLDVGVYSAGFEVAFDVITGAASFEVLGRPGQGVMMPPREWRIG